MKSRFWFHPGLTLILKQCLMKGVGTIKLQGLKRLMGDIPYQSPNQQTILIRFFPLHGGSVFAINITGQTKEKFMYMVVRKWKIEGNTQEISSKINKGFIPLITKIKGFVDYYCLFPDDHSLISVSVFQDKKGADESVSAAADFAAKNLSKYFSGKPEIFSGEVFAQGRAGLSEKRKTA